MRETCSDGVGELFEARRRVHSAMASVGKTLAGAPSLEIGLMGYTQRARRREFTMTYPSLYHITALTSE